MNIHSFQVHKDQLPRQFIFWVIKQVLINLKGSTTYQVLSNYNEIKKSVTERYL